MSLSFFQAAQPVGDVSNTTWTPSPIYPQVGEFTPDDSTYVTSSGSSSGDSFEVTMSPIAFPVPGPQILRTRLSATSSGSGSGRVWVKVELRQGLTGGGVNLIAQRFASPTGTFAGYDFTLLQSEQDLIEYNEDGHAHDLRVRITTLPPVTVSCCPNPVPAIVFATFSAGTGSCACLDGATAQLVFFGSVWNGFYNTPSGCVEAGLQSQLTLVCSSGTWVVHAPGPCLVLGSNATSVTCSPLSLVFTGVNVQLCCTGTVTITVTE